MKSASAALVEYRREFSARVTTTAALAAVLLAAHLAAAASARAADTPPVAGRTPRYADLFRSSAISFVTENDKFFAGTDRHYTNGFKLSFLGTTRLDESPSFIRDVARFVPTLGENASNHAYKVGVSLGHSIYTPVDTDTRALLPGDRPYAGWLYGSLDFQARSHDDTTLRVVEIAFGIVGPSALGRPAQNEFHDLIDVPRAEGWDNQLRDEPGLIVSWERRHRLLRLDLGSPDFAADVIGRYGLALGNVHTHALGGIAARIGWRLDRDFGTDLIRSSSTDETAIRRTGVYFFANGEARAVARNLFLDGNTWRDSHSVRKRPVVADFSAGLAFRFALRARSLQGLQLAYAQNYRTKEFHGQLRRDVFGSISMSLLF